MPRSPPTSRNRAATSSAIATATSSKCRSSAPGRPTTTSSLSRPIKTLKKLDLSFTYVTDRGIKKLRQLQQLEDLTLDHRRVPDRRVDGAPARQHALRGLNVRGVDITDAGMPYVGEMTGCGRSTSATRCSATSASSISRRCRELEELKLGGNMITGLNLNFLKLLPKLKR